METTTMLNVCNITFEGTKIKKPLKSEVWADIPDLDNLFQASNKGRIAFINGSEKVVLTQEVDNATGYSQVTILKPQTVKKNTVYVISTEFVHRLIINTFFPEKKFHPFKHVSGDFSDNKVTNLKPCTPEMFVLDIATTIAEDHNKYFGGNITPTEVIEVRKVDEDYARGFRRERCIGEENFYYIIEHKEWERANCFKIYLD